MGFVRSLLTGFIVVLSFQVFGAHVMGGNISYECLGGDMYEITLTYYADCFGATASPPEQDVFFFPQDPACAIPFSFPFSYVSEVEITDLCPSELLNSSCNGGFLAGVLEMTYTATIFLDPACVWDISWESGDWQDFVNIDNTSLPNAYIGTTIDASAGCTESLEITSSGASYLCIGEAASHFITVDNPNGYDLVFSLTDALTTGGVPAPWEVGYDGTNPIPGISIDPVTGEITVTGPPIFGNYLVAIQIDMYDAGGNYVGSFLENMIFVIQLCSSDPTEFSDPGVLSVHPDVTITSTNSAAAELFVCAGDSLCFTVEAVNGNPFRTISVTSDFLDPANFPTGTETLTGVNPVTAEYCVEVPEDAGGTYTVTIDAIDDACFDPGTDQIVITINVSPSLIINVTDTLICDGANVPLVATGDTDFTWNILSGSVEPPGFVGTGGTQDITPASSLQIEVIANNADPACVSSQNISVNVSLYSLDVIITDETCNGGDGAIDLTPLGGTGMYTYWWTPVNSNSQDLNGIQGGTYNLTVTDIGIDPFCAKDTVIEVLSSPPPSGNITGNATICEGECTDITFNLMGTSPFTVDLVDLNTLVSEATPAVNDLDTYQVCPTQTTVYELQSITDSNNPQCSYLTPSQVTITVLPNVSATFIDPGILCDGDVVDIEIDIDQPGTFDLDYNIDGGATQSTTASDGQLFNITVTQPNSSIAVEQISYQGAQACPNSTLEELTIDVSPLPTAVLSGATTICDGEDVTLQIDLTGTGPWEVTYSENAVPAGAPLVIAGTPFNWVLSPGPGTTTTYCLTNVEDLGANCSDDITSCVDVIVNSLPSGSIAADGTICDGDTYGIDLTLNGNGPFDVLVVDAMLDPVTIPADVNNGDTFSVSPTSDETYCLVEITDDNGCMVNLLSCVDVTVNPNPTIDISADGDASICQGDCHNIDLLNMTGTGPFNVTYEVYTTAGDVLVDSGTEVSVANGDIITVCPTEDVYVIISEISDSAVPACSTTTNAGQVNIDVFDYSAVQVSQDSTICVGGQATLTFCFTNVNPTDNVTIDLSTGEQVVISGAMLDANGCYDYQPVPDPVALTTYTITNFANDQNPCTQIDVGEVTIDVFEIPTGTLDSDVSICPGQNATITVTIPTAGGPFDIDVEETNSGTILEFDGVSDQFTFDVSPIATETYTLILIEDNTSQAGCSSVPGSAVTVTVLDSPIINLPVDTICDATAEFYQIEFEITGGDPATYAVANTQGNDPGGVLSALPPYIYTSGSIPAGSGETWQVTDASGCVPFEFTLDPFDCPVLTDAGTIDLAATVACSDGIACVTPNGDEFLDPNDVLSFILMDDPDFASAVILDISASNCWDVMADLAFPPLVYGQAYYVAAVAGNDDGNGLVDLGNPNISVSTAAEIVFSEAPTATISGSGDICIGDQATLQIDFTGTGPFTMNVLQGGAFYETLSDITDNPYTFEVDAAGDYTLTLLTNGNCTGGTGGVASIVVNPLPTAEISPNGVICDGQLWDFTIDLTGTANWDVEISFDDGMNPITTADVLGITGNQEIYQAGAAGTYFISSVTDGNGCTNDVPSAAAILTVDEAPTAELMFGDTSFCAGENIDLIIELDGTGPWTLDYTLDGTPFQELIDASPHNITIGTPGTYCLEQVEDAICSTLNIDDCIVVTEIPLPIADAGPDVLVCSQVDQILGIPGDPALDYEWTGDIQIIDYPNVAQPIVNAFNNTPGGDNYSLTLTVTGPQCTATDDVNITILPEPQAEAGEDMDICYGDIVDLVAIGGTDCLWTDNGWFIGPTDDCITQVQPLDTAEFFVEVIGFNGCSAMDSVTINVPEEFIVDQVSTPTVCFGECVAEITITPSGGYGNFGIDWPGSTLNTFNETDVCPGLYDYTVTDDNGCSIDGQVDIAALPEQFIDEVAMLQPNCYDDFTGTVQILDAEGVTYTNATIDDTNNLGWWQNLPVGAYTVSMIDVNGCFADTTVYLESNSTEIAISNNFDTTIICINTPIDFVADANGGTGEFDYFWYGDVPPAGGVIATGDTYSITPSDTVEVWVVAIDELGCPSDTLPMVAVFQAPVFAFADPANEVEICQGECLDMSVNVGGGSGDIQVTWELFDVFNPINLGNDISITQCPMEGSAYVVYADDGCQPVVTDTVFVIVHETPEILFEVSTFSGCYPLTVDFVNLVDTLLQGECVWDLDDGNIQPICSDFSYTYSNQGTYYPTLNVTSDEGCTNTDSLTIPIEVYGYPSADFTWEPTPASTIENQVDFINQSIGGAAYNWVFAGIGSSNEYEPTWEFPDIDLSSWLVCLEVVNQFGCADTICKDVLITPVTLVYVPNAFTPDEDGINDVFFPVVRGVYETDYTFRIWDRWGRIIFETNTIGEPWLGDNLNGEHYVQNDVYVWEVIVRELATDEKVTFKGHVTIVR